MEAHTSSPWVRKTKCPSPSSEWNSAFGSCWARACRTGPGRRRRRSRATVRPGPPAARRRTATVATARRCRLARHRSRPSPPCTRSPKHAGPQVTSHVRTPRLPRTASLATNPRAARAPQAKDVQLLAKGLAHLLGHQAKEELRHTRRSGDDPERHATREWKEVPGAVDGRTHAAAEVDDRHGMGGRGSHRQRTAGTSREPDDGVPLERKEPRGLCNVPVRSFDAVGAGGLRPLISGTVDGHEAYPVCDRTRVQPLCLSCRRRGSVEVDRRGTMWITEPQVLDPPTVREVKDVAIRHRLQPSTGPRRPGMGAFGRAQELPKIMISPV